jgi:hypothetical protein
MKSPSFGSKNELIDLLRAIEQQCHAYALLSGFNPTRELLLVCAEKVSTAANEIEQLTGANPPGSLSPVYGFAKAERKAQIE